MKINYDDEEMKNFIMRPLEKGLWLKCKIERKIVDKKTRKFFLYVNDVKHILTAVKITKKNYSIYMKEDPTLVKDKYYLGKLNSNFFGTEFNIYDSGKKPKKGERREDHRINLGSITYVLNFYLLTQ